MRVSSTQNSAHQLRNKLTLVILGRSGSGKGTQARFILKVLKKERARHLETGRFLRSLIKQNTTTAFIGRELMSKGRLLPSWIAAFTWMKELIDKGHINKHLVYDGAPRRIWEAELIDDVIRWHGRSLPICVYIDISTEEATGRLLRRGRKDDTPFRIRNRMRFFQKDVLPTIGYYKKQKRLVVIDGSPPPQEVWRAVSGALVKRLGRRWPKR